MRTLLYAALTLLLAVSGCKTADNAAGNISEIKVSNSDYRNLEKQAPKIFSMINGWKKAVKRSGYEPIVKINEEVDLEELEAYKKEYSFFTCLEVKNKRKSILTTFFTVALLEAGITYDKALDPELYSLFDKKMFGPRSFTCDRSGKGYRLRYVFVSGDGKFLLDMAIKDK